MQLLLNAYIQATRHSTFTHHSSISPMMAVGYSHTITVTTVHQIHLISITVNSTHVNWSNTLTKTTISDWNSSYNKQTSTCLLFNNYLYPTCSIASSLSTHHISILLSPWVTTDCPPVPIMTHLHSSFSLSGTTHKTSSTLSCACDYLICMKSLAMVYYGINSLLKFIPFCWHSIAAVTRLYQLSAL